MKASEELSRNDKLKQMFISFNPNEIDTYCKVKVYEKGSRIMNKGDYLDRLIFLSNGNIKVVNEFESGLNYTKLQLESVCLLGHIEALSKEDIIANTIISESRCVCIEMSKEQFIRWTTQSHDFALKVLKSLAIDFYMTIINQGEHLLNSSIYKLVKLLIDISESEFAKAKGNEKKECIIKDTKKNMAEKVGVSERTINRNILKLKDMNFISNRNRKIIITKDNYEKLKEYLSTL